MVNRNARQITLLHYLLTFLDILWMHNFLSIYVEPSDLSQAAREISLSWFEGKNIRKVFHPKYRLDDFFHDTIGGYSWHVTRLYAFTYNAIGKHF